eukprot:7335683-Ditylum_brightwellii.AAC.1
MQQEQQGWEVKHFPGHSINIHLGSCLEFISLIVTHVHKGQEQIRHNLAPHTIPWELPDYCPSMQSTYDAADAMNGEDTQYKGCKRGPESNFKSTMLHSELRAKELVNVT